MKHLLISIVAAGLAACVLADETATVATGKSKRRKRTVEELTERARTMPMRHFGGYVLKPKSASGKVIFLNAQKMIPATELDSVYGTIDEFIHPIWKARTVASVKLPNPKADIVSAGGAIGVVLAESADLPALVTAPEDGWAIVNVSALAADKPEAKVLASRARKEVLRAFALIGGCSFMCRGPVVMRSDIRTAKDLDMIKGEELGIDAMAALERNLPLTGVTPWYKTTYKKACEQGWAPAPTNEYQKAIWDKVHQLPTKPIQIKPESKPVKE